MSVRMIALGFALLVAACDGERELLERDLSVAQTHLHEIERSLAVEDAAELARADALIPDLPRGALTATVAAFLAGVPGAEVDGSLETSQSGYLVTDPIEVTLPADLRAVVALLDFMSRTGRIWQLDAVKRDGEFLRVRLHAFNFGGSTKQLELEVTPNENTLFSKDRDAIRDQLRATLGKIDQLWSGREEEIALARKRELKRSIASDVADKLRKLDEDSRTILEIEQEAALIPEEMTIAVRMGRRICSIKFKNESDKQRILAVAGSRPNIAIDKQGKELVLKSGRVCTLSILPPNK